MEMHLVGGFGLKALSQVNYVNLLLDRCFQIEDCSASSHEFLLAAVPEPHADWTYLGFGRNWEGGSFSL